MYGYVDDSSVKKSLKFGLNQKVLMTKFEYNAEIETYSGDKVEGIECTLEVDGKDKKYNIHPVTKAKDWKTGEDITDPKHKLMKQAINEMLSRVVHIMKCFVDEDEVKAALSVPSATFKGFAQAMVNILPKNYAELPLHLCANWQWMLGSDNDCTFTTLPKKTKHGAFLCAAIAGEWLKLERPVSKVDDEWECADNFVLEGVEGHVAMESEGKKVVLTLPNGTVTVNKEIALAYVSEVEGGYRVHPFSRSDWFMCSNFGQQQRDEEDASDW